MCQLRCHFAIVRASGETVISSLVKSEVGVFYLLLHSRKVRAVLNPVSSIDMGRARSHAQGQVGMRCSALLCVAGNAAPHF